MPVVLLFDLCQLAKPVLAALLDFASLSPRVLVGYKFDADSTASTRLSVQQGLQNCYLLTVAVLCVGLQGPHPKSSRKSIKHTRYSKMQRREKSMTRWDSVL